MRGKTSKRYRKLMQQYELTFGFREPYQVLVDAQMIQDTSRFTMDLVGGLERTLRGKVKPMITQCSIRHLYELTTASQDEKERFISVAKQMERRRCNHHTLEKPLSTLECLASVIDPKKSNTNKNRYVVASQAEELRKYCRGLKGVPLVYVKRSVMVMEPMADGSVSVKQGIDRGKFRMGLRDKKAEIRKRKREEDISHENGEPADTPTALNEEREGGMEGTIKKKRIRGPKGPNPLSVKKPKKKLENLIKKSEAETGDSIQSSMSKEKRAEEQPLQTIDIVEQPLDSEHNPPPRKRRKRKHKPSLFSNPEVQGPASIEDS